MHFKKKLRKERTRAALEVKNGLWYGLHYGLHLLNHTFTVGVFEAEKVSYVYDDRPS